MSTSPYASRTVRRCAWLRALALLLAVFLPGPLAGSQPELAPAVSSEPAAPSDDDTQETAPRPYRRLPAQTPGRAAPLRPAPVPDSASHLPDAPLPLPPPLRARHPLPALRTVVLRC
jgi:hypothetical protein